MDNLTNQLSHKWERLQVRLRRAIFNKAVGPAVQRLINGPANLFDILPSFSWAIALTLTQVGLTSQFSETIDLKHRLASRLMHILMTNKVPGISTFPPGFDEMSAFYTTKDVLVVYIPEHGNVLVEG